MKIIGKLILCELCAMLIFMYGYGGYIFINTDHGVLSLGTLQLLSGILFLAVTSICSIIIIALLFVLFVIYLIWSFKKDDRTFLEFVKGII